MKYIKNFIPEKKKALLIGNGHSALQLKYIDFNKKDYDVYGINHMLQPVKPDFIIYYDTKIYGTAPENYYNYLVEDIKLIGSEHNKIQRCDYIYNHNDINFSDTGNNLLQLIYKKYEIVYLIGYDYKPCEDCLRYINQIPAGKEEFEDYEKTIFNRALHKWYKPYCNCTNEVLMKNKKHKDGYYECKHEKINLFKNGNIFNLYSGSKLRLFPFKNIKEL